MGFVETEKLILKLLLRIHDNNFTGIHLSNFYRIIAPLAWHCRSYQVSTKLIWYNGKLK